MPEKLMEFPPLYWLIAGFFIGAIALGGRSRCGDSRTPQPVMLVNPDGSLVFIHEDRARAARGEDWRDGSKER